MLRSELSLRDFSEEEQAELTPEQAMERANNRLKDQHARTISDYAKPRGSHLCLAE